MREDARSRSGSPVRSAVAASSPYSSQRDDGDSNSTWQASASTPGKIEPALRAVIKRYVVHVDAHNRYLEKRQMWKQHEKDEKEKIAKKRRESHGVFAREHNDGRGEERGGDSHRRRLRSERSYTEDETSHGERTRTLRGSFDVHAADRVVTAREKERKRLRQITEETGDQWRPDKFYTDELKTEKPWINPYEVMVKHLVHPPSEGELTPKADSSSSSSSISSDFDRARRKAKKKKKKAKKEAKKLKKERKKLKKKLKRLKA